MIVEYNKSLNNIKAGVCVFIRKPYTPAARWALLLSWRCFGGKAVFVLPFTGLLTWDFIFTSISLNTNCVPIIVYNLDDGST